MQLGRSIESRHEADEIELDESPEQGEPTVSPVGIGLAALGGGLVALSALLPLDESGSAFARVQSNSLIQHEGWVLIALGVLIALAAATLRERSFWICVLGIMAGAAVAHFASDKGLRTLYTINSNGEPNSEGPSTVVPLGIAIYVMGVGAALAFIGGWVMTSTRQYEETARSTTECPDCAETILADARVCKHCGLRFDGPRAEQAGDSR